MPTNPTLPDPPIVRAEAAVWRYRLIIVVALATIAAGVMAGADAAAGVLVGAIVAKGSR